MSWGGLLWSPCVCQCYTGDAVQMMVTIVEGGALCAEDGDKGGAGDTVSAADSGEWHACAAGVAVCG